MYEAAARAENDTMTAAIESAEWPSKRSATSALDPAATII
jgi:hypothetical protein